MTLYMVVTQDEYELPLIVSESMRDIADYLGTSVDNARSAMYHEKKRVRENPVKKDGTMRVSRIQKVEVEEE